MLKQLVADRKTIQQQRRSSVLALAGRTEGNRLSNLVKLYHVPVFALRELLESRFPDRKLDHLRQAELVRQADEMASISEDDVQDLYENYRYGRSLAFYLYLLPSGLLEPDIGDMQRVLDSLADQHNLKLLDQITPGQGSDYGTCPNQITLLDQEELESVQETRFRYYVTHRFLNVEEEPDQVLQSQFGFMWLDLNKGYLAILSRDEQVNSRLTRALSTCLKAIPLPIRFPKELLDKHFSIERARRLCYYDPGTGVHRCISGHALWQRFEQEIMSREQQFSRPSSLYDEEIAEGVISGVGVTASKGKIYLTRTLPTSVVRSWARRRLPELMQDVRQWRTSQPNIFSQSTEAMNRMRLPTEGRATVIAIVEAILQTERESSMTGHVSYTAKEIYKTLAGKYFKPYLRTQCNTCDEMAELCPSCEGRNIKVGEREIVCQDCKAHLCDGDSVVLRCMNGHVTPAPLSEAWSIAPNHWLQKRMSKIFAEMGQSWDEKNDYFYIEGNALLRIRKDNAQRDQLPAVIQNYISNFWDPVGGQVHAGNGDIVVNSTPTQEGAQRLQVDSGQEGEQWPRTIKNTRDFEIWIRGTEDHGFSVEASIKGGGVVQPQLFLPPRDESFQLGLARVLSRTSSNGDMQATGDALFRATFPPRIRKLWQQAVAALGEEEGLRLTLHIEPRELSALPWEMLFEGDFIGLRKGYPIVRYLDIPGPSQSLNIRPPLRVLVVVTSAGAGLPPRSVGNLQHNLDARLAAIRNSLSGTSGKARVDLLRPSDQDELFNRLRRGYHILHFIGSGRIQQETSYLLLNGSRGDGGQVPSARLGQLVADGALRLVMLDACELPVPALSRGPEAVPQTDFGQIAQHLVSSGLPAVVTMQPTMSSQASIAFDKAFYTALVDGMPLDTAVQEGRQSTLGLPSHDGKKAIDWALPTLHMRTHETEVLAHQEEDIHMITTKRQEIRPTVTFTPTFHGPIHGPVHTGTGAMRVASLRYGMDAEEITKLFEGLSRLVEQEASPDKKPEALREVGELKEAVLADRPNLGKMESVLRWFKENVPQLAGAVGSVILNPLVGKVMEAAGDIIVEEFKRRFGG